MVSGTTLLQEVESKACYSSSNQLYILTSVLGDLLIFLVGKTSVDLYKEQRASTTISC
jgi:hypothetical protein